MHVIAQVRNYIDVTDEYYSEEMEYLNRWDTRIQNQYDRLIEQIDDSKFHSMMDRIFGKNEAEDLQMSAQASSQQILSLIDALEIAAMDNSMNMVLSGELYSRPLSSGVTPLEGETMDVLSATEEDWNNVLMEMVNFLY